MKRYFILGILLTFASLIFAQSQTQVKESLTLESKVLKQQMAYSIYLPAGYQISQRSYPVLYLLHGRTGDEKDWIHYGELEKQLKTALEADLIPQMIIVMPQAFDSYYLNSFDGALPYERYFIEEFLPYIETTYRVRKRRDFRAIAGLSMGGYGALNYSVKYPELFGACGALSAAVYSDEAMSSMESKRYEHIYGPLYGKNLEGERRMTKTWKDNSPFHLMKKTPAHQLNQTHWYIDCGDDDYLNIGNSLLHLQMLRAGIRHEFRVRDGAHNWPYWRKALIPCMTYICQDFRQ